MAARYGSGSSRKGGPWREGFTFESLRIQSSDPSKAQQQQHHLAMSIRRISFAAFVSLLLVSSARPYALEGFSWLGPTIPLQIRMGPVNFTISDGNAVSAGVINTSPPTYLTNVSSLSGAFGSRPMIGMNVS